MKASALAVVLAALLGCAGVPWPCLDPASPAVTVEPDGTCATDFLGVQIQAACCLVLPPEPGF